MNRVIPGFTYCPQRRKYFKIEPSRSAPANAFYNAENIKKRRIEQEVADEARRSDKRIEGLIKRASILADPMTGARLMHEAGIGHDPELPNKSWLNSFQEKGKTPFRASSIDAMYVNGDDYDTGMPVIYAATRATHMLQGSYAPCDSEHRIRFDLDVPTRDYLWYHEPFIYENITSISYYRPSHQLLQTSKVPRRNLSKVTIFKPVLNTDSIVQQPNFAHPMQPRPFWILGATQGAMEIVTNRPNLEMRASRCRPSVHNRSTLSALIATSHGVMVMEDDAACTELVGNNGFQASLNSNEADVPTDTLSVDYHPTNPNIIFAGDRSGKFFHVDRRKDPRNKGWDRYCHRSSVAHIRTLDDFQTLAAGPNNAMSIYDIRWMAAGYRGETKSVCTMHKYTNHAHINIGLDVTKVHGGEGIVAAASSNGGVDIFSLRTGMKMQAGALDELETPDEVIKCVQWAKNPYEDDESLWVGVGGKVKKFSYGHNNEEDSEIH